MAVVQTFGHIVVVVHGFFFFHSAADSTQMLHLPAKKEFFPVSTLRELYWLYIYKERK